MLFINITFKYIRKNKHTVQLPYRYDQFIEPPRILNVQYQRYTNVEQEKQRNRVNIADLMNENPQNQQVINHSTKIIIKPKFNIQLKLYKCRMSGLLLWLPLTTSIQKDDGFSKNAMTVSKKYLKNSRTLTANSQLLMKMSSTSKVKYLHMLIIPTIQVFTVKNTFL